MTITTTKPTFSTDATLREMLAGCLLLDVTFIAGARKGERVISLINASATETCGHLTAETFASLWKAGALLLVDEDDAGNRAFGLTRGGVQMAVAADGHASVFDLARKIYRAEHPPASKAAATRPDLGYTPSIFQEAIFGWVETGSGDGIVKAVAGAGKSTTLVSCGKLLTEEGIFLAFNKAIADELGRKLAGTMLSAKTIHAVGNGALRRNLKKMEEPDDAKYTKLVKAYVEAAGRRDFGDDLNAAQHRLKKLCHFTRLTLTPRTETAVEEMAARYNLDFMEGDGGHVSKLITDGDRLAIEQGIIDFTDMLWLTVSRKFSVPRFRWVLVDECQDLNACQLALVRMLRAPGGRMLFVGDPNQAIMGFAGADTRSYETIKATLKAREFPLSICYRCPEEHIKLAQALVPQMEPASGAPAGEVLEVPEAQLTKLAEKDDMILSRRNAPLIKHCLRLINAGKAARIKGRDIGRELAELVRTVDKLAGYRYDKFLDGVKTWEGKQRATLDSRDASESAYELLSDKVETLRELYANAKATSGEGLADAIAALFADESKASVWLSSVHRAKGLEANRVFILEPDRLGQRHPKASEDEFQQELNLKYVALTRAKYDTKNRKPGTLVFLQAA